MHLSFLSGCSVFFNIFSISSFYSILNSLINWLASSILSSYSLRSGPSYFSKKLLKTSLIYAYGVGFWAISSYNLHITSGSDVSSWIEFSFISDTIPLVTKSSSNTPICHTSYYSRASFSSFLTLPFGEINTLLNFLYYQGLMLSL